MEIIVKNLTKSFNKNVIFKDATITFKPNKIYGLIGRNGSGKSVFLKTLCGFLNPDSGLVEVNGVNIFNNNCFIPNTRAMIERPTFIDELTGFENLMLLASIQKIISKDIIIDWLKRVDLYNDRDKKYSNYSLGMKQKLAIVQVLMENPDIMILDEPFNGLDKDSYKCMMDIFKEQREQNKIIIIATHIENDIDNLCDEIYEFDNSKITQLKNNK